LNLLNKKEMKQAIILLLLTLFGVTACNTEDDPQPENCRTVAYSQYYYRPGSVNQYYTEYTNGDTEFTRTQLQSGEQYCD